MRTPQLPAGSVVAGYRVISLLGEGSTGAVYLAEPEGGGDRVALKVLGEEFARDERFRKRFIRESSIAASLHHPHVVPILDFGEADGELYLAMRHVDGEDLRALIAREGPLDPPRALNLVEQIAEALDDAHAKGLVHRDVKPANILVEGGANAYLADFGLAKHASSASSLTGERSFVGTIAYVSPEQVKGEAIDGRADVYSLGCVLHEALTGSPPFDRESELAVVYGHLNDLPPRVSDLRPELPEGLDRVVRRAMAKEPDRRYSSCAEMIAAASAALAGEAGERRRVPTAVATALAVVGAAALTVVAVISGGDDKVTATPRVAVAGTGLALVDAHSHRVTQRVALPERPSDLAFGGNSAYALLPDSQRVIQLDAKTRRTKGTIKLPFRPGGIAIAAGGQLFVTESQGEGLVRIDARTHQVEKTWRVPTHGPRVSDPSGIAAGAGSVWVARGAEVVRVDPRSGKVVHRFPVPVTATLLTFANGQLWAASSENGLVEKIDPATDRIAARARLHGWISALAVSDGSVWASVVPDDVVFKLSEDDASIVGTHPAGRDPTSLSTAPGALWIAGAAGRELSRLDSGSGARASTPVDGSPEFVRYHGGLLWVVAAPDVPAPPGDAAKGPEIRVAVPNGVRLDPAVGPEPALSQLLYATCMKLVNYPDAAGAAGRQLQPDAAAAMPTVSADKRTYTFQIKRGLRFSPPSGQVLDAQTFERTIERTLAPKQGPDPVALHVIDDVVGAKAFQAGRAKSISGIRASGQTLSITLEKPAGDLLSRLAQPLFCAVPPDTPIVFGGVTEPIASAGPYYIRASTPEQIVLERNPNYHGARPRVPGRIVYLTTVQTSKAVALADGGRVDLVPWDYDLNGPLAPGGALARSGSARYRVPPAPGLDLLVLNAKRRPFSDPRLRRAVNYALDRHALAAVYHEQPTDRYVPAAVPGSSGRHVYPVDGPDPGAARGVSHGHSARLYFCGEPVNLRIAQIVRSNLRAIGIRVTIDQSLACLNGPDPKARLADIRLATFSTPELDPAPFLHAAVGDTTRFGPPVDNGTAVDGSLRRRLRRADALAGQARLTAYARIEDALLRGPAPYAAFASFTAPEYFSARTGCRLLQGAYNYADLGALCVPGGG